MTPFRLTDRAGMDLIEIGAFTEQRWGRKQRNHYLAAIDKALHQIAEHPAIGSAREDLGKGYLRFQSTGM